MNLNHKQKAWAYLAIIVAAIVAGTALVVADVINWISALLVVVFGCLPLAKYVWQVALHEKYNPVRILKAALPKCGFNIENMEWNDEHTAVRFYGTFNDEKFVVATIPDCAYIDVIDLPWTAVKITEPWMNQFVEAVNDTNADSPNMSVIVCEPNEDGIRNVCTMARTILPAYNVEEFLNSLMCHILNRKPALTENFHKERPWLNATKHGPIGFNVAPATPPAKESDESLAPAAKDDTSIN